MYLTEHPPSEDGIVMAPTVVFGTARADMLLPPTVAFPLDTVYVHVMPSTVALAAMSELAIQSEANTITNLLIIVLLSSAPVVEHSTCGADCKRRVLHLPATQQSDTKRTSLRVPLEAVEIALTETQREETRLCVSLLSVISLETLYIPSDDCLCSVASVLYHTLVW